jgi:hypothetical protein
MQETRDRVVRTVSWVLAVAALVLSLSGWFIVVGLGLALPAALLAKVIGNRRALTIAIAAACVSVAWLVVDLAVG